MSVGLRYLVLAYATLLGPQSVIDGLPSPTELLVPIQTRRDDYTYTPGIGGHILHTSVTTWKQARRMCKEAGGHLAVINSQAEADVIAGLFGLSEPHPRSYSPNNAWIGTWCLPEVLGDWETIYGDSLELAGYNEWHETKARSGPHCGAVFRDGKLSWFNCRRLLGFVCEVPYVESSEVPKAT